MDKRKQRVAHEWEVLTARITPEQMAWIQCHIGVQDDQYGTIAEFVRDMLVRCMTHGIPR